MKITLIPLHSSDRADIEKLSSIYRQKSVARFISISENYFNYVTGTLGVIYYKILADETLTGGIQCETDGARMYLDICVDEACRHRGIAKESLKQLLCKLPGGIKCIEVSIDETNTASLALFEKIGFIRTVQEDELITYCYSLN